MRAAITTQFTGPSQDSLCHEEGYDVTGAEGAEVLITPVGPAGKAIQRMT
jgi:hypothetical protein